jgi:hypothetical protein
MISNSDIQGAWITKLKSIANITTRVPAVEIREDNYKGTDFNYPMIRVKLGNLTPTAKNNNCLVFNSEVSILVFTEQKSSKQTDDIAGVICTEIWGKSFTLNGVRFTAVTLDSLAPAETPERDENAWMSSVNLTALVSSA